MARGGGRGGKVPDRKTIKTKKLSSKASLPVKNSKRGRPKSTPTTIPSTSKSKSTPIPSTSKGKSTPNPSTSKSASEKAVRGKRKSAVNNPLIEQYNQEKRESQSKAPPAKKIKLAVSSTPTQKKTAIKKNEAKSMPSREKVLIKIQNVATMIEDIPNISSNQEPVIDEDEESVDNSITAITVTKEDSTVLAVSAVVEIENDEQIEKKDGNIKSEVKEEITTERDTFENQIDESSTMDFNEHVEEEVMPLKITDVYEFKDSMEMSMDTDSDSEPNSSIEDIEKNTKQKMQKTLLVKCERFIDTSNISDIRNLHPELDKSSIIKTFFSYFFFIEATSKETREEVKVALKESVFDFDLAEFCHDCANSSLGSSPNCSVPHAPDPKHLNKIAKLIIKKNYPGFEKSPDCVLVVRRSRCIELDEVDDIMKLSNHIKKLNFGQHFFLECSSVESLKDAEKLLTELNHECHQVSNPKFGYRTYDRKENGFALEQKNRIKQNLKEHRKEERTSLLLLGPAVKHMSTKKVNRLENLIGKEHSKKPLYFGKADKKSDSSDYDHCAVAFFKTEEEAIKAYTESQYIYYMNSVKFQHVNIVFMSQFLQDSPPKFVKSKPKAKTSVGKIINKTGALTVKKTPQKIIKAQNHDDSKKDPTHPTYLPQNYDSDNFSGSEEDTGRRKSLSSSCLSNSLASSSLVKSLPPSSLATSSFGTSKSHPTFDNLLVNPSLEQQPPLAQSTPAISDKERLEDMKRDREKTREKLQNEEKPKRLRRPSVDVTCLDKNVLSQSNLDVFKIEQSQNTVLKLEQEVSELKQLMSIDEKAIKEKDQEIEKLKSDNLKLKDDKNTNEILIEDIKDRDERIEEYREKCVNLESEVKEVAIVKNAMETLKEEHKASTDLKNTQIEELRAKVESSSVNFAENETLKSKMAGMEKQLVTKNGEIKSMKEEKDKNLVKIGTLQAQLADFKAMKEERVINLQKIKELQGQFENFKAIRGERDMFMQKIEKLQGQLENFEAMEEEKEMQLVTKNGIIVTMTEEKDNNLLEIKKLQEQLLQKEKLLNDNSLQPVKVKELEEKLTGCQQENKELQEKIETVRKEKVDRQRKDMEVIQNIGEKLKNTTNELKDKNKILSDQIKSLEEEAQKGIVDDDSVALLEKQQKLIQENNQVKLAVGRLERENLELKDKIGSHEEIMKANQELKRENESLKSSLKSIKEQNEKSGNELKIKENDFEVLCKENQSLKSSLENAKEQNVKDLDVLGKENQSLKSSLEIAKEQNEKHGKENQTNKLSLERANDQIQSHKKSLSFKEAQHTEAVTELNKCKEELKKKEKDIVDKDTILELEEQHKKVIQEKDNEIQIFESRLESLQASFETADENSKKEAENLFNAQILEEKKKHNAQIIEEKKKHGAKIMEEKKKYNALIMEVKKKNDERIDNWKKSLKVDLEEKYRQTIDSYKTELSKREAVIKRQEVEISVRAGTSTSVTNSPNLERILRQPAVVSTHSNVMNHPNPPSLSPQSAIGGKAVPLASLLEGSINPFEKHPQRKLAASAQTGLLPIQTMKSRTPPLSNATMNTSTVVGPTSRVQMGAQRGRGSAIQGASRTLSTPITTNSHFQVSQGASQNQQRRKQPTPIAPRAPIGPNGNVAPMSSPVPRPVQVMSSFNQQSPSLTNQQMISQQAFSPPISSQQSMISQQAFSPSVSSQQSMISQHAFTPSISSVFSVSQQPISEAMQRQEEERVMVSSPEEEEEEEDEEEESEESKLEQMIEGLISALKETWSAKQANGEDPQKDVQSTYTQLLNALTEQSYTKEFCTKALNAAYKEVYGITDFGENGEIDVIEIRYDDVPNIQASIQQQQQQQLQQQLLQQQQQQQQMVQMVGFGGAASNSHCVMTTTGSDQQQLQYVTVPGAVGQVQMVPQQPSLQAQRPF